jgi:hypothetical protein
VTTLKYREVAEELEAAVSIGAPYSLVRLGDGENSVLRYPGRCSEERIQAVMAHALEDRAYSSDEIGDVRRAMVEAVNGSDVVGYYPSWWPAEYPECALFQEDLAYAGIRANKACYPAIHYYLAASGSLSRIIASANYVTLITGRDVKVRFDRRYGTDAEQVLLSAERMYRLREEGNRPPHYPDVYRSILSGIEAKGKGHVFLIGGGILAKAYCYAAKRAGGIGIDVGSVFDYWAGIPSREEHTTVVGGVLVNAQSSRKGLGLDDEPLSQAELNEAYKHELKPLIVEACPN